jgi:hypothetical protein
VIVFVIISRPLCNQKQSVYDNPSCSYIDICVLVKDISVGIYSGAKSPGIAVNPDPPFSYFFLWHYGSTDPIQLEIVKNMLT